MALTLHRCRKMIDTIASQLGSVVLDFADAELMLRAVENSVTDPYLRTKCSHARSLLKTAYNTNTDAECAHWLRCAQQDVAVVRLHLPAPKDPWS